jgi:hypothetical protein
MPKRFISPKRASNMALGNNGPSLVGRGGGNRRVTEGLVLAARPRRLIGPGPRALTGESATVLSAYLAANAIVSDRSSSLPPICRAHHGCGE